MRVFVAGATGAIGKQLVPRLVAAGHEAHGMTRSESKQAVLHELGAKKPLRVPRFVGRLFAGEASVVMMTELRGASNGKAKRERADAAAPSIEDDAPQVRQRGAIRRGGVCRRRRGDGAKVVRTRRPGAPPGLGRSTAPSSTSLS